MASHHAIAATTTAVHRLLADAGAQDADWQTADISILQADELQNPVSAEKPRISVYLYRVNASVARHGRWPRTGPAGQRVLAPVIVDLHYLVTAWSRHAATAQQLLGWAIRVLGNTAVIPPAVLNRYRSGLQVFGPDEGVELVWEALSLSELMDVWQVAQTQQAPAASYVARGVAIDSEVSVDGGDLVRERYVEYVESP